MLINNFFFVSQKHMQIGQLFSLKNKITNAPRTVFIAHKFPLITPYSNQLAPYNIESELITDACSTNKSFLLLFSLSLTFFYSFFSLVLTLSIWNTTEIRTYSGKLCLAYRSADKGQSGKSAEKRPSPANS